MLFGKAKPGDEARENAASLLVTSSALVELSLADAREVVKYMRPLKVAPGTVFIQEGESTNTNFMMLILEGDVTIENEVSSLHESMVMSIMGPGSLIGEMGLLDGAPRSATCTATTEVAAAVLSREALLSLIKERPGVGARLMLAISKRMSERLRETNRKLRTFAQLSRALQQELDATHLVNRQLMGMDPPPA